MKTRIHVNGQNLRANKKDGGNRPVFTAKDYKRNRKGNHVLILGPSSLEFSLDKRMKSGAVAWIETYDRVKVWP